MQLADRDRLIIAAMGDGSYRFSNQLVCHQIAETMKLPVLVVIGNNKKWGAQIDEIMARSPAAIRKRRAKLTVLNTKVVRFFGRGIRNDDGK